MWTDSGMFRNEIDLGVGALELEREVAQPELAAGAVLLRGGLEERLRRLRVAVPRRARI